MVRPMTGNERARAGYSNVKFVSHNLCDSGFDPILGGNDITNRSFRGGSRNYSDRRIIFELF